jgi:archaellum component FlaF (FlaF/FlaG flagellin family)
MKPTEASKIIFILTILLSAIVNPNIIREAKADPTFRVYIAPVTNSYPPSTDPNQNFTISVNVEDAPGQPPNIGIHTYTFYIYWNPSILKCLKVTKGPWLSKSGTYVTYFIPVINNTEGSVWVTESIRGEYTQSGSGTLATITFQPLQPGLTKLDLNGTSMIKHYFPGTYSEIVSPAEEDGYFQYPLTTVSVQPEDIFQAQGYNFTANITATNLYNLNNWAMNITWNPSIVNLIEIQEAPWNTTSPTTFNYTLYAEEGTLNINSTLQTSDGETGNKTLATLTFQVLAKGSTNINIINPVLLDNTTTPHQLTIIPGTFISIPKISTNPKSIIDPNLKVGDEVNLNLTITNVDKLNSWSLNFTWDPNILNLTSTSEGEFLQSISEKTFTATPNQEQGFLTLSWNATPDQSVNGSGILATIKFTVKIGGRFTFKILNSTLTDINGEDIEHITEAEVYFDNRVHDIAITAIQISTYEAKQNQNITITVTVLNNGTIPENFTLLLKFGRAVIATKSIENLQPSQTTTIEVEFAIKNLPGDTYEVRAQIAYLGNEQAYNNNILSDMLTVTEAPQGAPIDWGTIIPIIIVIIAILSAALYLLKKTKKYRR